MMPPATNPRWSHLRRRVIRWGIALGLVGLTWTLAHRPLLVGFAFLFRVDDPPTASDAVVVLIGGSDCRPLKAAELYRRGLAPVVLLADLKETERNRQVLICSGVPAEAIRILPGVGCSTRAEALRVRDYVGSHPVRRITVVTSAFHTARARWIFQRVLRDTGVEVRAAASRDPEFTESDWYTKSEGRKTYLIEALKTFYYHLTY